MTGHVEHLRKIHDHKPPFAAFQYPSNDQIYHPAWVFNTHQLNTHQITHGKWCMAWLVIGISTLHPPIPSPQYSSRTPNYQVAENGNH